MHTLTDHDTAPAPLPKPPGMTLAAYGLYCLLRQLHPDGRAEYTAAALEDLINEGRTQYRRLTGELRAHRILVITSGPRGGRLLRFQDPRPANRANGHNTALGTGPLNNYPEGVVAPPPPQRTSFTAAKPHRREAPSQTPVTHTVDNVGEKPAGKLRRKRRTVPEQYLTAARLAAQETLVKHPESLAYTVQMMVEEFDYTPEDATQWLIARGSRRAGRRGQSLRKNDVRRALENPPLPVPETAPPAEETVEDPTPDLQAQEDRWATADVPENVRQLLRPLVLDLPACRRDPNLHRKVLAELACSGQLHLSPPRMAELATAVVHAARADRWRPDLVSTALGARC